MIKSIFGKLSGKRNKSIQKINESRNELRKVIELDEPIQTRKNSENDAFEKYDNDECEEIKN